jgi:hypothetical protein
VYVGDGIKVGKEGRKMPGVKRLHQESEDVSKPEWIRGHYFNALSILVGVGKVCFALPLVLRLDDGIKSKPTQTAEVKPTFRTWHKELKLIQDSLDWQKCLPAKVSAITIC